MRTKHKSRAEDASLVAKLADLLLERAEPQFIAAARRKVALTEAQATARVKATAPTGKPATKTTKTTKTRKPWRARPA